MKLLTISLGIRGGTILYAQHIMNHMTISSDYVISKYEQENKLEKVATRIPLQLGKINALLFLLFYSPFIVIKLIFDLSRKKYDALYVLGSNWADLIYILIFRLFRKPIFYTVHEAVPRMGVNPKKYIQLSLQYANSVIFLSDYVRKQAYEYYKLNKPYLISPHGLLYNLDQQNEVDDIQDKPKFLLVGMINQYKGVDYLLDALPDIDPNIFGTITIAGTFSIPVPDSTDKLKVINQWLEEEEMIKLVKETDYLLLPYKSASQSGVATLALSFLKPAICSNIGALNTQFGDGAIYMEDTNSATLKTAIEKACTQKNVYDTLCAGLLAKRKELEWGNIIKNLESFLLDSIK